MSPSLTRIHCRVSDTQVTVKPVGFLFLSSSKLWYNHSIALMCLVIETVSRVSNGPLAGFFWRER